MLHRIDGDLHIEQVSLNEIKDSYGTPCYVYSEQAIQTAYRAFDEAFEGHPHDIRYAVKANSNLAVLQTLAQLGSGFDIVSGGELTRVLAAGGDASKVVFSGVGKQDWEIEYALESDIGCINVESASELHRIARICEANNRRAPISIRINPDVDPNTHPYIATGLKENKFGVSIEEAISLYSEASNLSMFRIVGIDCHIGSQITDLTPFLDALERILSVVDLLAQRGITLEHIDLGGGLGVRYQDEDPIDVSAFASAIGQLMSGRPQSLMFEPGRLIVANAGILLTSVIALKSNAEKNFAVVDAAMNDLIRPALYSAWQDVVVVNEQATTRPQTWDIVGPVCETADFLAKDRELSLEEDGLLAIRSVGAYGFVMSSNYNSRGRAPEILVSGDRHYCVRRRETIEDLLELESLKTAR